MHIFIGVIKFVCALLIALTLPYLNLRTVRAINCSQCPRRARHVHRKIRKIRKAVDMTGKGESAIVWHYDVVENEDFYRCRGGHTTKVISEEELDRQPEVLWLDINPREIPVPDNRK